MSLELTVLPDELSVCRLPASAPAPAGPLDFGLTGMLLSIVRPLADAGVGIFALSTYGTDYVLVKQSSLEVAVAALTAFGHRVG